MTIDDLASATAADIYYDPLFRVVLEDHMTFLRTHPETRVVEVTPQDANKYQGDFDTLCAKLGIAVQLRWVVMRMNKFTNAADFPTDLDSLLVPSGPVIERIRSLHLTQNKIKT